ncbi:S41 family peptidase [Fuerstiella marisgermanici]|uniref:Carboxy-terminal processing protease CtpA n=1 Tax=Fuerstiella marisgermanici TaxID=1891926 RepID=A0A1P8WB21_9PLAN|nr:S41 family peptidase [Fuerstiella marisgermanici]APZ91277.1 Carboxy-terminal processing protease CtpA precursor [Fuerstiella marisgermanici]
MLSVSLRSAVLLVLLVAAPLASVPTAVIFADDAKPQTLTDYDLMSLFVETFQQIEVNYVRDIDRRELMEAAIQGMLGHLDQYSSFIPPRDVSRFNQMVEQEFGGIGITVNMRNGQLIVVSPLPGTPAFRAGIRAGDVIVGVDGDTTDGMNLSEAVQKLQGPVGRPVTVQVVHAGEDPEPEELKLVRQLIKAPTVRGDRYNEQNEWDFMLEGDPKIGYVRLSHFSRYTAEEVKAAIDQLVANKMQGLILDLRFNPGGLLESAIEIADMFLDSGNIVSVKGRNVPERSWEARKGGTFPNFPIAILVNNYSASASEVLSAALQDNKRAVVIGERSWGKGSVQNVIRMEEGDSALKLTTASYHRPSGVNIHRFPDMKESDQWGVTPDEGYELAYTSKQWRQWDEQRSKKDVLGPAAQPGSDAEEKDDEATKTDTFVDTQLTTAIDYIKKQLEK